jgi:drug/metabolite transporter (DMT)-like permease
MIHPWFEHGDPRDLGYYLLILLAAFVWGSYSVVSQSVLSRHPQVRVMAFTLTLAGLPLVAVLSGALLLVERITWGQGVGGLLIVAGVIAVNRRPARPKV